MISRETSKSKILWWKDKNYICFFANNFELSALEIALIYKYRWQVKLFFMWLKQHLKVKKFWGISENVVKIQIFSAIITHTSVAIIKEKLKSPLTNYEILQILNTSLLNKTALNELITKLYIQNIKKLNCNPLKIFEFQWNTSDIRQKFCYLASRKRIG